MGMTGKWKCSKERRGLNNRHGKNRKIKILSRNNAHGKDADQEKADGWRGIHHS